MHASSIIAHNAFSGNAFLVSSVSVCMAEGNCGMVRALHAPAS